MYTWVDRVKERMDKLNIDRETLAKKMGVTYGAITHYLTGRRVPPLKQFAKLALILKIDPAWLQYGPAINANKMTGDAVKNKTQVAKNPIPILSWQQAANIIMEKINTDTTTNYVPYVTTEYQHWYALRVQGESMIAPSGHIKSFHEGEIIIIDPDQIVKHGDFVIAASPLSREATFKQFVIDSGIKYLKPLNPQYPIVKVEKDTIFCGAVIGCVSFDFNS